MTVSALHLDASSYVRHPLHGEEQLWVEKNCYVDVWIEVLHALGLDPHPALAFTVALDYEGDQWTFFKPPHADLQSLYGIEVSELNVYRPLLEHAREHLSAGKLIFTEADALHLPDTAGTDYRTNHVKTTIVLETVDPAARRLGYFHNSSYHQLQGEDFEGVFRTMRMDPFVVPLFAELVKVDRMVRRARPELAAQGRALLGEHLRRRPAENPFERFARRVPDELQRLKAEGIEAYHQWAFATTRQVGANFELLAAFLGWLDAGDSGPLAAASQRFQTVSSTAKSFILKGARAVSSSRPAELGPMLAEMGTAWDEGMKLLVSQAS